MEVLNSNIADSAKENIETSVDLFKESLPSLITFGKSILIALLVFVIARKIIGVLINLLNKSFEKSNVEISVAQFLSAIVKVGLNVLLLIIIVDILGLPTSSLLALVGSAGLTIGLALQGSLANFAGGVLILLAKPFKVGDYIIENGNKNEGTVSSIDIFYTRLLTNDNKMVVIPNGTLSNSSIVNVTNEEIRRLDLNISVRYSEDTQKIKELLNHLAIQHELVLKDYDISVFISNFDPNALNIGMRVWVEKSNYWILRSDLLEQIKNEFDRNDIIIPLNPLNLTIDPKR